MVVEVSCVSWPRPKISRRESSTSPALNGVVKMEGTEVLEPKLFDSIRNMINNKRSFACLDGSEHPAKRLKRSEMSGPNLNLPPESDYEPKYHPIQVYQPYQNDQTIEVEAVYPTQSKNIKQEVNHEYSPHAEDGIPTVHEFVPNAEPDDEDFEPAAIRKEKKKRKKYERRKDCASEYLGVSKRMDKWRARLKVDGKWTYVGVFVNELDAARATNRRAHSLGLPLPNPSLYRPRKFEERSGVLRTDADPDPPTYNTLHRDYKQIKTDIKQENSNSKLNPPEKESRFWGLFWTREHGWRGKVVGDSTAIPKDLHWSEGNYDEDRAALSLRSLVADLQSKGFAKRCRAGTLKSPSRILKKRKKKKPQSGGRYIGLFWYARKGWRGRVEGQWGQKPRDLHWSEGSFDEDQAALNLRNLVKKLQAQGFAKSSKSGQLKSLYAEPEEDESEMEEAEPPLSVEESGDDGLPQMLPVKTTVRNIVRMHQVQPTIRNIVGI